MQLRGPREPSGEIDTFADLLVVVRGFTGTAVAAELPEVTRVYRRLARNLY